MTWTIPEGADAEKVALAESLAAQTMRALTAYRVGGPTITVMPCGNGCIRPLDRHTFTPYMSADGRYFNRVCGCRSGCFCQPTGYVYLDGPVGRIDDVQINGESLAPNLYRVDNGYLLVRTDGKPWPSCGGENFTVTYMKGYPVDVLGQIAGGIMASEWYKALTGARECRLPANVTGLTRQGVTMEIQTGMFPGGRTGIREVDMFLNLWNPYALKVEPTVSSPDVPRNRATTWRGQ